MGDVLDPAAGLAVVRALQALRNPVLDAVFLAITALGTQESYLVVCAWLLWRGHAVRGRRLLVLFLVSSALNADLKDLFASPRPYEVAAVTRLDLSRGHGLPSGHAQNAVVVLGYLAAHGGGLRARLLAFLGAGLIGLSRVYLGAHFPLDVAAGWAIGAALLALALAAEERVATLLAAPRPPWRRALLALSPAFLLVLGTSAGAVQATGALIGAALGFAFPAGGARAPRRFLVELLPIAVLVTLTRLFLGGAHAVPGLALLFAVYAGIGLWLAWRTPREA